MNAKDRETHTALGIYPFSILLLALLSRAIWVAWSVSQKGVLLENLHYCMIPPGWLVLSAILTVILQFYQKKNFFVLWKMSKRINWTRSSSIYRLWVCSREWIRSYSGKSTRKHFTYQRRKISMSTSKANQLTISFSFGMENLLWRSIPLKRAMK